MPTGWREPEPEYSNFRRVFKLEDWTFVFALPTTSQQFTRAQAYGEFCLVFEDFSDYKCRFLDEFDDVIAKFEGRGGLRIVRFASSRDYARALRADRPVVLYTHSFDGWLEFSDGMIDFASVVQRVSPDFRGIADISACQPLGFDEALKRRVPGCAVKIMLCDLTAVGWIQFYGYFFSEFLLRPRSYAEAIENTSAVFSSVR
jgi:hypothetical protein